MALTSKTIVFIHGLFMNPKSWGAWMKYFEARGYKCHAPAYPYHEGEPADRRNHIDPALGKLNFGGVVKSLSAFIDTLPEKPILIGHSIGGLAVQKLIQADKGAAGISIVPAPPMGILTLKWSFVKGNLPLINPLKGNKVWLPSLKWFHYAFCNTLTMEQTAIEFEKYVVPESRNIPRSSIGRQGKIHFRRPHHPLLIIGGERDHIIPYSLNRRNHRAYKDRNSITDFKLFPGRCHYICGQEGWEEVAGYIHDWVLKLENKH